MLRNLFNLSYQRAVVPDFYGFFHSFYAKLIEHSPVIAELFKHTDMQKQVEMLIQSITYITSYGATREPDAELTHLARLHGSDKLDLPPEYYDIWLDCLLQTIREKDPKYDEQVEKSWRLVMEPGIEYMKSFCSRQGK